MFIYTTQYRKDNLLLYIFVTLDVSHFDKSELNSLALSNTAKPKTSSIIHPSFPIIINTSKEKNKKIIINKKKKEEEKKKKEWLDLYVYIYTTQYRKDNLL